MAWDHPRALLVVLLVAPVAARAELDADAAALLRRSIAAHGGAPARLRLEYRGAVASPDQAATPDGPFGANPWTIRIAIDERRGALAFDPDLAIDGDFHFRQRVGFADGRGFAMAYNGEEYDELGAFPAAADGYLPHRLLRGVLDGARAGHVERDPTHDRVTYTTAAGESRSLLFYPRSHLLVAHRRAPTPSVYGDQTRETRYDDYRPIGGTLVPGTVVLRVENPVHGATDRVLRLVAAAPGGPSAAELTPPPGAVRRAPEPRRFATLRLARDVYLLQNVATEGLLSYHVLAVVFADHVLVVEAVLDDAASRRVIDTVAGLAPGRPIRTLVQTHHHGDHLGGLRTYLARETTIVAPQGMRRLVERIAATHALPAARVDEVRARRVIRDARNEVWLHDLPSGHSAHMLVVYLPEQRILYQGDLISAGELPPNATSRVFLDWLRGRRLAVTTLAGVHGRLLEGRELQRLLSGS
jgi:glyoxylase-like metal-dependent hydrolase (beta-lactamase superfamily II)